MRSASVTVEDNAEDESPVVDWPPTCRDSSFRDKVRFAAIWQLPLRANDKWADSLEEKATLLQSRLRKPRNRHQRNSVPLPLCATVAEIDCRLPSCKSAKIFAPLPIQGASRCLRVAGVTGGRFNGYALDSVWCVGNAQHRRRFSVTQGHYEWRRFSGFGSRTCGIRQAGLLIRLVRHRNDSDV